MLKINSVAALDLARGAAGAGLILRKHDESAVVSLCMITTLLYLPLSSWNEEMPCFFPRTEAIRDICSSVIQLLLDIYEHKPEHKTMDLT
jgi:hypothetical protein